MKVDKLFTIIINRILTKPSRSYVAKLIDSGNDRVVQKIGEEAIELVIAGKNNDRQRIIEESADLFFHVLILLAYKQISITDLNTEFKKRHKIDTIQP